MNMEPVTCFRIASVVAFLLFFTNCYAGGGKSVLDCPISAEMEAAEIAGTIRDWDALHDAFVRYHTCDDGVIAEGFTESVVRILVDDWSSLSKLVLLVNDDPGFLAFVYRHIDETADANDLSKILNNLKQCEPDKKSRDICVGIQKRTVDALKDM